MDYIKGTFFFLPKTFSLDIHYFFIILFLLNFLAKETVSLTPELDNMTSKICYLETTESRFKVSEQSLVSMFQVSSCYH